MSLVCLMMGLRVPCSPPLDYDIESFTKAFGSRGGGYFYYHYDGVVRPES